MLEALFGRWPLKLLALCLAFAVWAAVTSEGRILQDHRVPVDLALPDDLILQGSSPSTVTVRLRGPEGILKRIDPYGLEVRVDLKDATPGQRNVQFGPDNVEGVPNEDLSISENCRFTFKDNWLESKETGVCFPNSPEERFHGYLGS